MDASCHSDRALERFGHRTVRFLPPARHLQEVQRDLSQRHPQISGKNGGQSLNLHKFARDGVVRLGHVRDARNGHLVLAPDLKETLATVDQFEIDALKKVDDYIARMGLQVPWRRSLIVEAASHPQ